jgi:hypothetical protein
MFACTSPDGRKTFVIGNDGFAAMRTDGVWAKPSGWAATVLEWDLIPEAEALRLLAEARMSLNVSPLRSELSA